MGKKLNNFFSKKELIALLFILLISVFLRFYKLAGFVTFLGDQGRDAIVIKRILTFEHFPAIGAPTSVGQIFLGPFYYYFIAPWLLLTGFDPIGLALGVAFFSSVSVLIIYLITRELFDRKTALIATFLFGFSSTLIEFSRFSWNPNLLPLFSLLSMYFLIKSLREMRWYYYVLSGAFYSFAIQLHYIALFLLPPAGIYFLLHLNANRKRWKELLTKSILLMGAFLSVSIPLIIFDLRHQFLNIKNFLTLMSSANPVATNKLSNLLSSFSSLNLYTFHIELHPFLSVLLLFLFIISFVMTIKKGGSLQIVLLFFLLTVIGVSLYGGPKYSHYFGVIYPFYYMLIGYFLSVLLSAPLGSVLMGVFLVVYLYVQSQGYYYFTNKENNQIETAKSIARIIANNVDSQSFRLTSLPQRYADTTYRYFLEIWGKKPIEKDSLERTTILFVTCESTCKPIGDPQWDVAYFAPRKIVGAWNIGSVTIYKLIR